jgi:uncharacterized protein (DUF1499 family)
MNWPQKGALLSLLLAILALLLLAIAPLGWRAGWWHYRFAFSWLMTSSGILALAAAICALVSIVLGWSGLDQTAGAVAVVAMLLGAFLAFVPWQYNRTRYTVPRIHDITTDIENPPQFAAVLPARAAEHAASSAYEGRELARQQRAAYPDIEPLTLPLAAGEAFQRALEVARAMPGWTIVASDPGTGRIEASQASRWFRFIDDIVIRVSPIDSGSRLDMRSLSRQGRSDFGVNAARIRSYMSALKKRLA